MRIAQLSKTYGIEKRAIEYYTTCGLIPYSMEEGSNFRDYGPEAEAIIKKIMILRDVGFSAKKIDEALHNPSYFTTSVWNEHIAKLQRQSEEAQKHYEEMINFAMELRDTNSFALHFSDELDLKSAHIVSRLLRKYIKLFDEDTLLEKSESLPDDMSNVSNIIYMFIKSMKKKMNDGQEASSVESQQTVSRFFRRIKQYYGIGVFLVYTILKDETPESLGLDSFLCKDENDDSYNDILEYYEPLMKLVGICADWCREAKSIANIQNYELFKKQYQEQIEALDREVDDSTVDLMIELLSDICKLPNEITSDWVVDVISSLRLGSDIGIEMINEDNPIQDLESVIELVDYIFKSLEVYFNVNHHLETGL